MKKISILSVLLIFIISGFAQIPSGYYDGATGTGGVLKTQLHGIISNGHSTNDYDDLYNYYQQTDNYPSNNKVWDMYSVHADGTSNHWFSHLSDECHGSYTDEGQCYNREHSVPASWFGDNYPMYADLFLVIPTDGYVNNRRSSYPYGEVSSSTWASKNGSKLGDCSYPGYTSKVFEPIDEFKGDIARAYFYIVTRYDVSSWNGESFSGDGFSSWTKNMLLEWNELDPISQKEINRNDSVYKIQHNRNPYIDHPEWVCEVFGGVCSGLKFTSTPITSVIEDETYTYSVTFSCDEGLSDTLSATTLPSWLTLTQHTDSTATLTGTPTDVNIGNNVVVLSLTDGTDTRIQSFTIVVSPAGQITFIDENFETCMPINWLMYDVAGVNNWTCGTGGSYLYINAYNNSSTIACEDWAITPALDFSNNISATLSFSAWTRYADNGIINPELKVYYSIDYIGSGNPNDATWTELSYSYPAEDSQSWKSSGDIDLSNITATSVYIGFKYVSSGTSGNSSSIWELDNVKVVGQTTVGITQVDDFMNVVVSPNPFTENLNISYNLIENSDVQIRILDLNGKIIDVKKQKSQHSGNNDFIWNASSFNLTNGIYFVQIISNKQISTQKVVCLNR